MIMSDIAPSEASSELVPTVVMVDDFLCLPLTEMCVYKQCNGASPCQLSSKISW